MHLLLTSPPNRGYGPGKAPKPRTTTTSGSPFKMRTGGVSVVERCRRYVAKMPDSIEGSDGSGALFNVCREVFKGFARVGR